MSLRPMPSPRGTNQARRFVVDRSLRGAAYDEAPKLSDEAALDLLDFLRDKLNEADLAEFCRLTGIDQGVTMDEPAPFKGMPQAGGKLYGEDSARRLIGGRAGLKGKALEHALSIKVSP